MVTSETTGGPILLASKRPHRTIKPLAVRVGQAVAPQTRSRQLAAGLPQNTNCAITQDHSIVGDTPSSITFDNESGVTVAIYWLDYGGSRVLYNSGLVSGTSYAQPTWITHPWVAVDDSNTCLGYTISDQADKTYVIKAPLVVNSTDDADDGTCDATHCSLRDAINVANGSPGPDTITFAIGAAGSSQTILPTSTLPAVTDQVVINGWSQGGPSYTGPPLIGVDASANDGSGPGLSITGSNVTVRGLGISRFNGPGIDINGGGATGNLIEGNYVGTDLTGATGAANTGSGIQITGGAANNTIGGTDPAARNVISGNGGHGIWLDGVTGNLVEGNFAGTSAAGTARSPTASMGSPSTEAATTPSAERPRAQATSRPETPTRGSRFSASTSRARRGTSCRATSRARTRAAPLDRERAHERWRRHPAPECDQHDGHREPELRQRNGLRINGAVSTGNTVQGNYIGTDRHRRFSHPERDRCPDREQRRSEHDRWPGRGQRDLGNTGAGIALDEGTGLVIQGNNIGVNASAAALGNGGNGVQFGVVGASSATNTQLGGTGATDGNVIANNGQAGVAVSAGSGNSILRNAINANAALGHRPRAGRRDCKRHR